MRASYAKAGKALPPLFEPPNFDALDLQIIEAFFDLSTCRSATGLGTGAAPVPWLAARAYWQDWPLARLLDFEDFWTLVKALDQAYLKVLGERAAPAEPLNRKPIITRTKRKG